MRIRKQGNYIVITDDNDKELFNVHSSRTDFVKNESNEIDIFDNGIPNFKTSALRVLESELKDEVGGELEVSPISWLRDNTGFKAASGGSGAGGDSYMQMYANKKYVLPSSGRFAGVGGTVGYTNSDVDLDSGDTTAIGYIADAAAVVIGTSDFAYKLEQIRASSNAMTFADEIQLAVGYRDIRDGQFYNNNSANPVLLHTENIVKSGSTGYNCWTKLITFATPLDIPANKEVVIGYKCTIFDGAAASVNMWHCATTLTLKKV
jgi:hypothetical protein